METLNSQTCMSVQDLLYAVWDKNHPGGLSLHLPPPSPTPAMLSDRRVLRRSRAACSLAALIQFPLLTGTEGHFELPPRATPPWLCRREERAAGDQAELKPFPEAEPPPRGLDPPPSLWCCGGRSAPLRQRSGDGRRDGASFCREPTALRGGGGEKTPLKSTGSPCWRNRGEGRTPLCSTIWDFSFAFFFLRALGL